MPSLIRVALPALVLGVAVPLATTAPATPGPSPYVLQIDLSRDIARLASDDPFESDAAVERLVMIGPSAVPVLAVALQREGPDVRAAIVDVVRQFDDPAAVSLLIAAAGDSDASVRAAAVQALGLRATPAGREIVEAALRDPNPKVREAAVVACARTCTSPEALGLLVDAALADDQAMAVRQTLAAIVADPDATRAARGRDIIARQAVPALTAADRPQRVRAALTAVLIGEPAAVPILAAVLREGPDNQAVVAAFALAPVASPEAVAALAAAARTGSVAVVKAACISLHNLKTLSAPGADAAAAPCPGAAARPSPPPTVRSDP